MNYLNARYYDNNRGQFLSQDPMFWSENLNLTNPQSFNTYSYAENNPVNRMDPSGLLTTKERKKLEAQIKIIQLKIKIINLQLKLLDKTITGVESFNDPVKGYKTVTDQKSTTATKATAVTGMALSVYGGGAGKSAVSNAPKLLNPAIKISEGRLGHVLDNHTLNGMYNSGKSIFNEGENIVDLIKQGTQQFIEKQKEDRFQRIFDVGRNIGIDRATGEQTSIMTVITNEAHEMWTAFPGIPK